MKKEKVNALLGGKVVSSFLKRHQEIVPILENFIIKFPCFKKVTEVLAWLQNGVKIKKCIVCGKRIDYQNSKREKALFCSMACRKTEKGNEIWKSKITTENPFSREDVKEKIRKTNLEKYGVEYAAQSKIVKEKQKRTMIERYGVEHNSQMGKFQSSLLNVYYEKLVEKLTKFSLVILTPKEDYRGVNHSQSKIDYYNLLCQKCNKPFHYKFNNGKDLRYACPHCHPFYRSRGEEHISIFLKKYVDVITNDRTILNGNELDIVIPDKKVAVEYNGLFWHSESQGKDKNYHLNKLKSCNENGYRLIQIFEYEWENKERIVKNRLKTILGLSSISIGARKCEVKEVDNSLSKKFLEKYHIQGYSVASVRLGLFYKNRLVAIMTFSKARFNKKCKWELVRYCTIGDFSIVGGAGKLLKHFREKYSGSIVSYADKRWSDGNLYRSLGFIEEKDSLPAYWYVKDGIRYSRIQFQKHKLSEMLEIFDENLSESENMTNNGYHKVYDCGNKVFILS
jgi:hypothetical protein